MNLNHIGIAGVGVLGASIGLSLKAAGFKGHITGIVRNLKDKKNLLESGILDSIKSYEDSSFPEFDLLVVCTPVRQIVHTIVKLSPHIKPSCIVTDVGSVKSSIVFDPGLPTDIHFVGSHPMAGTEKSGFLHGMAGFFKDKPCILTPTDQTDFNSFNTVKTFWAFLGSKIYTATPKEHDAMLAVISHLPHVLSFSFMHTVHQSTQTWHELLNLTGGSFKDFSRIAHSSPEIWLDILMDNKDAVLSAISHFEQHLNHLKQALHTSNADTLNHFLTHAH